MADNSLLKAVADRGIHLVERNQLRRFDWLLAALEVFVAQPSEQSARPNENRQAAREESHASSSMGHVISPRIR